MDDSEPEPDGVIARGTSADDDVFHPPGVDVAIVLEVADASLSRDRGPKLRMYARAGIPIYWIVNLIDRQIEVYSDPDPSAIPEPVYRKREVIAGESTVPVWVAGKLLASMPAVSLLPPL